MSRWPFFHPYLIERRKEEERRRERKKIPQIMTLEETKKILRILASNYPNSFSKVDASVIDDMTEIWASSFINVPVQLVRAAITAIIKSDRREFAPNVAQVMYKCAELVSGDTDHDAADAWEWVRAFIQSYPQEDYSKYYKTLSPTIRAVVGVSDLRQIANNPADYNANYERPRFIKQYNSVRSGEIQNAIETGRLDLIADPFRVKALGLSDETCDKLLESGL